MLLITAEQFPQRTQNTHCYGDGWYAAAVAWKWIREEVHAVTLNSKLGSAGCGYHLRRGMTELPPRGFHSFAVTVSFNTVPDEKFW